MTDVHTTHSITGEQFELVLRDHDIVIIDFWAVWCAPCRAFSQVYEKVAAQYENMMFAKVNIEEERELAEAFQIRSIPHLMVFKKGIAIYSEAGSMPASTLKELVQQALEADVSDIKAELEKGES